MIKLLNRFLALSTPRKIVTLGLIGVSILLMITAIDAISAPLGTVAGPFLWLAYMALFVYVSLKDTYNKEVQASYNSLSFAQKRKAAKNINYNEIISSFPTWLKIATFLGLFLASIAGGGLLDKILHIEDHLGMEFTPGDLVRIALITLFSVIITVQGFKNPKKK